MSVTVVTNCTPGSKPVFIWVMFILEMEVETLQLKVVSHAVDFPGFLGSYIHFN